MYAGLRCCIWCGAVCHLRNVKHEYCQTPLYEHVNAQRSLLRAHNHFASHPSSTHTVSVNFHSICQPKRIKVRRNHGQDKRIFRHENRR